jgi:hypothetical protein
MPYMAARFLLLILYIIFMYIEVHRNHWIWNMSKTATSIQVTIHIPKEKNISSNSNNWWPQLVLVNTSKPV